MGKRACTAHQGVQDQIQLTATLQASLGIQISRLACSVTASLDLVLHLLVRGAGPFPHFSGRQAGLKAELKLQNFCKLSPGVCFADEWVTAHT